jgi:hypothetical protein
MPAVPIEFLRGVVGLIGVGCAHMLARSAVAVRRGQVKLSRMYGWLIRTVLCLMAVWYPMRPAFDTVDLVVWPLAAIAFGLGWWDATRVKKQDDLTHEMFPDE